MNKSFTIHIKLLLNVKIVKRATILTFKDNKIIIGMCNNVIHDVLCLNSEKIMWTTVLMHNTRICKHKLI